MAGNAKVGNRVNLWTRWQALEYITSQNFERRALNTLNAVSVVPELSGRGVRKLSAPPEAIITTPSPKTRSHHALLQAGYWVNYEDRALAYTEAPSTANALMRQRFRCRSASCRRCETSRGSQAKRSAGPGCHSQYGDLPDPAPLVAIHRFMFVVGMILTSWTSIAS